MGRIILRDLDENTAIDKKAMRNIYGGTDPDRYENQDVNYLLTRVESYTPIITLTSNLDIQKK